MNDDEETSAMFLVAFGLFARCSLWERKHEPITSEPL